MKKLFWILVSALISAIVATSLTVALDARSDKHSDPDATTAPVTTAYVVPGDDPSIPECETPGEDVDTIPPMVEPEWPEAPGAE